MFSLFKKKDAQSDNRANKQAGFFREWSGDTPAAPEGHVVAQPEIKSQDPAPVSDPVPTVSEAPSETQATPTAPTIAFQPDLPPAPFLKPAPKAEAIAGAGFAPEYASIGPSTSRRRPGPSLNAFMGMARSMR
jgi:hypothetical protein